MPRPMYILVSTSGAVDEDSGLVSCFQLSEAFHVSKSDDKATASPVETTPKGTAVRIVKVEPIRLFVVSAWMRDHDDTGDVEFEAEFGLRMEHHPGDFLKATFPSFRFSLPIHRLVLRKLDIKGFPDIGVCLIESRIKHKADKDWLARQTYPVIVQPKEPDTDSSGANQPPTL